MGRPQWKEAEARLARLFGTQRRPLSGGNQNHGAERDDGCHPDIYLENKYGKKVPLWPLYRDTRDKAKAEGKGRTPVIGLQEAGKEGILLVFNSKDADAVLAALAAARGQRLVPISSPKKRPIRRLERSDT